MPFWDYHTNLLFVNMLYFQRKEVSALREITLPESPLFRGIPSAETENLLSCLGAERRQYAKGQSILRAGDVVTSLGLVLSGSVLI